MISCHGDQLLPRGDGIHGGDVNKREIHRDRKRGREKGPRTSERSGKRGTVKEAAEIRNRGTKGVKR